MVWNTPGMVSPYVDVQQFLSLLYSIKNDLCMSMYRHYDNNNQVASFYKLPLSISIIMISESFMN
jgi:hypothetical protein